MGFIYFFDMPLVLVASFPAIGAVQNTNQPGPAMFEKSFGLKNLGMVALGVAPEDAVTKAHTY